MLQTAMSTTTDDGVEMTKKALRAICKDIDGLYVTPSVNDRLYIHYKGAWMVDCMS